MYNVMMYNVMMYDAHAYIVLQAGYTALMYASQFDHVDIVRHLVRYGKASVNTRNDVSVQ